jgi:SAM-dependent methyltransferase
MFLNKLCNLEDWRIPELTAAMRLLEPDLAYHYPGFPGKREHRKSWEWAHMLAGLESLNAIPHDGLALGVGAGHEPPLFELTNRMRWVFATDIYGSGDFTGLEAQSSMLANPDQFARAPYNRNRLVVQHMDACDLRFEEATFDIAFCLSSIEHFGGIEGARKSLAEMARVLKPGGILVITTECIVNDQPHYSGKPNLELFTTATLDDLLHSCPLVAAVEKMDYSISADTLSNAMSLAKAVEGARRGQIEFPHLVLELEGRLFTSAAAFLRKLG